MSLNSILHHLNSNGFYELSNSFITLFELIGTEYLAGILLYITRFISAG